MSMPWVIDELAHAGPEHLDADFVAGFDRKQGYPPVDEDLDVLRDHGALTEDSTVVDLGAGTGSFAVAAASYCRRVVAVDVSPVMLEHVADLVAARGLSNVEPVHAGFLSYDHAGEPADAVYCRHALHQIPDFWKGLALHRISQTLRPGGVLRLRDLVYDFEPAEAEERLEDWMADAVLDPTVGYTREDFATHVRTEFSTYRWLLEPMIEAAGFEIVDGDVRRNIYASYTCLSR
ncbi:MAG: class I SAM-dependent methyltransferase [Nocardioidaceae bacterium]